MMLGLTTYTTLKFLHVLLAIVAVGFNASYGIWLSAAARNPEHEGFALRQIKVLDDRFANPAYALLLVTGLSMVWVGNLDLATSGSPRPWSSMACSSCLAWASTRRPCVGRSALSKRAAPPRPCTAPTPGAGRSSAPASAWSW